MLITATWRPCIFLPKIQPKVERWSWGIFFDFSHDLVIMLQVMGPQETLFLWCILFILRTRWILLEVVLIGIWRSAVSIEVKWLEGRWEIITKQTGGTLELLEGRKGGGVIIKLVRVW